MNPQIKFSHKYPKLWGQVEAELIAVRTIKKGGVSKVLRDYDCITDNQEYYPLPDDDLLQLIFVGNENIPFCTLRRKTPKKELWYKFMIGKKFEVVLTSTTPSKDG